MNTFDVKTNREGDENVESFAYGEHHFIHWTESFGYTITNTFGSIIYQNKLKSETVGDHLPFTFLNCNWFTIMGNDISKMMYVSFVDAENAVIKVINLKTEETSVWATGLAVKRQFFHNFCWLKYDADKETAQMAYSTEDKINYFKEIKKGENTAEAETTACTNPNIFFQGADNIMFACNFKEDNVVEMHNCHPAGVNKIKVTFTSKVTIQDFGMIGENLWYFTGIEGEAGKSKHYDDGRGHTAVAFLYDMAGNSWAGHSETLEEAAMKIHFLDDAVNTKEGGSGKVDMIDGFSMISNVGGQHHWSSTCANGRFITWIITKSDDGNWAITPQTTDDEQKIQRSVKDYEVSSFDRKVLYTWSWSDKDEKSIVIDVHSNIDERVQYFYFLCQLVGTDSKWQPADLWKGVDLLKGN